MKLFKFLDENFKMMPEGVEITEDLIGKSIQRTDGNPMFQAVAETYALLHFYRSYICAKYIIEIEVLDDEISHILNNLDNVVSFGELSTLMGVKSLTVTSIKPITIELLSQLECAQNYQYIKIAAIIKRAIVDGIDINSILKYVPEGDADENRQAIHELICGYTINSDTVIETLRELSDSKFDLTNGLSLVFEALTYLAVDGNYAEASHLYKKYSRIYLDYFFTNMLKLVKNAIINTNSSPDNIIDYILSVRSVPASKVFEICIKRQRHIPLIKHLIETQNDMIIPFESYYNLGKASMDFYKQFKEEIGIPAMAYTHIIKAAIKRGNYKLIYDIVLDSPDDCIYREYILRKLFNPKNYELKLLSASFGLNRLTIEPSHSEDTPKVGIIEVTRSMDSYKLLELILNKWGAPSYTTDKLYSCIRYNNIVLLQFLLDINIPDDNTYQNMVRQAINMSSSSLLKTLIVNNPTVATKDFMFNNIQHIIKHERRAVYEVIKHID